MKDFWNERYRESAFVYGKAPNNFFKAQISRLKPGKLLLPAEGEGRNAVYAALKGWKVDAFDFSTPARQKALQLAEENDVQFNYEVMDLVEAMWEPNQYDAVALIYVHLPPLVRRDVHKKATSALKPGGKVILEAFFIHQLGNTSGGPKDSDLLYTTGMLRDDFSGLHIERLEEMETYLDEGKYHKGKASVIRMLANKPNDKS